MENDVLVSVICNTYNQVEYIEDALKGFLMQKTDFAFEVLVHDDASTDGTDRVIRRYAEQYPDIIKPLIQQENQYSKGKDIILSFQCERIRGELVAFCEGDDYFTDATKLQRQADILRAHPDIDMCAHGAYMVHEKTRKRLATIRPFKEGVVPAEEVIRRGGGLFATNSLMCRTRLLRERPRFWETLFIDYSLQIAGALRAGIYFIPDIMSAYRYAAKGSWSRAMRQNVSARIRLDAQTVRMLDVLDEQTEGRYAEVIRERKGMIEINTLCLEGRYKEAMSKPYRASYKRLSRRERMIIRLHRCCPLLFALKNRILVRK